MIVFKQRSFRHDERTEQVELTGDALTEPVNGYLRPLNRQLMPQNFQIQFSYLHSNVIICIDVHLNSNVVV
jgi:hypothetical protein